MFALASSTPIGSGLLRTLKRKTKSKANKQNKQKDTLFIGRIMLIIYLKEIPVNLHM